MIAPAGGVEGSGSKRIAGRGGVRRADEPRLRGRGGEQLTPSAGALVMHHGAPSLAARHSCTLLRRGGLQQQPHSWMVSPAVVPQSFLPGTPSFSPRRSFDVRDARRRSPTTTTKSDRVADDTTPRRPPARPAVQTSVTGVGFTTWAINQRETYTYLTDTLSETRGLLYFGPRTDHPGASLRCAPHPSGNGHFPPRSSAWLERPTPPIRTNRRARRRPSSERDGRRAHHPKRRRERSAAAPARPARAWLSRR